MNASIKFSDRIVKLLDMIENKPLTGKELNNLYANTQARKDNITEAEFEAVIDAVERRIKVVDPRKARSMFGAKDAEARNVIEEICGRMATSFDLSGNTLRNGVKIGGDQIAGRRYVDVYTSYKTEDLWNIGIGYIQDAVDELPYLRVRRYLRNENNTEGLVDVSFSVEEKEQAVEMFFNMLVEQLG